MSIVHAISISNALHNNLASSLGRTGGRVKSLTMSGGLVLRDATTNNIIYEDGGAYTLDYHAERGLLARFYTEVTSNGLVVTNAHLFLYVYYTPCKTCFNTLRRHMGVMNTVLSRTLGYSTYFLGKGRDGYQSESEAKREMGNLVNSGWTVAKWRITGAPTQLADL
jgi:hypothetical protein